MRGHVRRQGKTSWSIILELERGPDGKRKQQWITFHGTKREADAECARLVNSVNTGDYVEPSRMTVAQLLYEWMRLEVTPPKRSPATFKVYQSRISKYLLPVIGHVRIQQLTGLHIERAYADIMSRANIKPQTLYTAHTILNKAFKRALIWGLVAKNPCDGLTPDHGTKPQKRALASDALAELLRSFEETAIYVPVLIAATTGLRRGEVLGLRWQDVDLDSGRLHVRQALSKQTAEIEFRSPKTKSGTRGLPMPPLLVEALRKHKRVQVRRLDLDLVCTDKHGNPFLPQTFSNMFITHTKRCGFAGVTPHTLRHSYGSLLLDNGHSIEEARTLLGHSTIAATAVYMHMLDDRSRAAADTIEGLLNGTSKRKKGTR